jgi:hypothetical protein
MHEEKESSRCISWTTEQGKEKEPLTRGEREAFKALKRSAKEALGIGISGISVTRSGYLGCWVYLKEKRTGTRVHRIIMSLHLKRELSIDEVVHHLNGLRRDNRIENLQLLSRDEHCKMHCLRKRSISKETILKIRTLYNEQVRPCEIARQVNLRYGAVWDIISFRSHPNP